MNPADNGADGTGDFEHNPLEGSAVMLVWTGAVALAALLFPTVVEGQDGGTSDRQALEALYRATNGSDWADSTNWLTDTPLAEWFGIATDGDGRVTELRLEGNGLSGPIPAELGQLSRLWTLHLGARWDSALERSVENELTGPIPSSLGRLSNLRGLYLHGNELTGPIPDALGDLANLESLNLWGNGLTGRIPDALGNLVNLESLTLGENELTGPIPSSLGRLSNLRRLWIYGNQLTGRIPDALGNLASLEWLNLYLNPLAGPLPPDLTRLSRLRLLNIEGTDLCVPADPVFQESLLSHYGHVKTGLEHPVLV